MSSTKRQHWVPQFYLRQFAIPETAGGAEQVWTLSRRKEDTAEPRRFTVKDAAVETFLYSPKHPDGSRRFETENKLAGLESTLAKLWPRLATEVLPLTNNVRKILAIFLATLYLRHPRRRVDQKYAHAQLVRGFEAAFGASGHMPPEIKLVCRGRENILRTAGYDEWKNAGDDHLHQMFVDFLNREAIGLAERLLAKRWSVILSDTPVFATSDEPFVLEAPPERAGRPAGFATPGVTLSFPICPHRLLRIDDKAGENGVYYSLYDADHLPFPACAVFNYAIWVNAHRFMFSHRRSDEVIREIAAFVDWAQHAQPPLPG
jgi:hypothetical protein